jgi:CTP:molybdopterin cytidylyltransferase MocA
MIDGVVLAAGLGRRMGRIKPLLSIDGIPALGRVLSRLTRAGIERPIVVVGHAAAALARTVDLAACRVVENPDPSRGLSSSLRLGLEAVSPQSLGTLIALADMPLVSEETVRAVVDAARAGAPLAAPTYRGRRGFPVFIRGDRVPDVLDSLSGDAGARTYLEAHRAEIALVEVDDPGCVLDLDRPGDLARIEGRGRCATCA